MTDIEINEIIYIALNGDFDDVDEIRVNEDLAVLLHLMYYSHLKMSDALKVRKDSFGEFENGGYGGVVTLGRNGKNMIFEVSRKSIWLLSRKQEKNLKCPYLITNTRRALEKHFKRITDKYNIKGNLLDVYYAGNEYDEEDIANPYNRLYKRRSRSRG